MLTIVTTFTERHVIMRARIAIRRPLGGTITDAAGKVLEAT